MRKYVILASVCLFVSLTVLAEDFKAFSPILTLDRTTAKQGEFFQAQIQNASSRPKICFNSREFDTFEIEDAKKQKIYRALVPIEALTKPGKYSLIARTNDWEQKIEVTINDNNKGISRITLDTSKKDLEATEKELNNVGYNLKLKTGTKLWSGKFSYPSKASKSSPFGIKRSYNGGPVDSYHKGLDFAGAMGSPVYAPADGKVLLTGYEKNGYVVHGNCIILDHGQAVTSIFLHLSKIDVHEGQDVKKGDKIGEVGHTGISTGPHLHWGVYLYGLSTEPELFVSKDIL